MTMFPFRRGGRTIRFLLLRPHVLAGPMMFMAITPAALYLAPHARAQQSETISGAPQWIQPQVQEMGIGSYTPPTGTGIFGGTSTSTGGGTSTGSSTDSDSLDTMMDQSWGAQAAEEAQSLGVNSSALAATCVVESGCQNVSGSGSITGAFQMTSSTFEAEYAAALAADPSLAATTTDDANDPASEAAAAAEYLKQGAEYLENDGISDPTALQVRGYYNFGPQGGAAIATADSSDLMSTVLSNYSASQLAANGITSGETVGQWQASVAAKMGNAASAPVLTT